MTIQSDIKEIKDECPKNYELSNFIYIDIIDKKRIRYKGKFLRKFKEGDDKKDEILNDIKSLENSINFVKIFVDEESVKNIKKLKKQHDFNVDDNINIKDKKEKLFLNKNKFVHSKSYTIDISKNNYVNDVINEIVKIDENIDNLNDLKDVKVEPFMNFDWTVNFYTEEPHKYWANTDSLEDYIDMIEENSDKDFEELKSKDKYVCHHHPNNYGLDNYVDKIIDEYSSKIKGEKVDFKKLYISPGKSTLKLTSYYIEDLNL